MSPGTRTLGSGIAAELTSLNAEAVHLVEIVFSSGTERLSTGTRDIDWDGFTWSAVGGILQIGAVEEAQSPKNAGMDIALAGIDQTIVSALLSAHYRGRSLKLWRAYLDQATGLIIVDPVPLIDHLQLEGYRIEENISRGSPLTVTIKTRVSLRASIPERRGIQCNLISHQSVHTDETFMQHVAGLKGKLNYWGTEAPTRIGGGGGGGNQDDGPDERL
ncbi:hypothetical protein LCGC14_0691680 [marine sediment metagenome]|uniref:Uncharacterized protein n=1 Tax=marine sediment metagenome TaxID=412755 RepID=A0A0F9QQ38_9ZZZZ